MLGFSVRVVGDSCCGVPKAFWSVASVSSAPPWSWRCHDALCACGAPAAAPPEVAAAHHRCSIVADEIRIVRHAAAQRNVVFVLGHAHVVLPKDIPFWQLPRRVCLDIPYKAQSPCSPPSPAPGALV